MGQKWGSSGIFPGFAYRNLLRAFGDRRHDKHLIRSKEASAKVRLHGTPPAPFSRFNLQLTITARSK